MQNKLTTILESIRAASSKFNRNSSSIKIIVASKNIKIDTINQVLNKGLLNIGENYTQEAQKKIQSISNKKAIWHLIGHLQSNKVKTAVNLFDLIQSVDSLKLAKKINMCAKRINKIQKILIQVKINSETQKYGIHESEIMQFITEINQMENILVLGLMSVPPLLNTSNLSRDYFFRTATLKDKLSSLNFQNVRMDELSMGTSSDFDIAIEEGATMVRIGRAIFGDRY